MIGLGCASGAQAQRLTVMDNNGGTVDVMIPETDEAELGYAAIDYSDDKFYGKGIGRSYGADMRHEPYPASEAENGMEAIDRKIRNLSGAMMLTCNEEVKKYIDRYTKAGRQSTSYLLGRAQYYDRFFEEALRSYGLPMELKYLPVIESGLNPNATSRVGAAGLWQFMAATGKRYDLRIDSYIDERRDPEKSSYAAARMLSDLYRQFGDWPLALAAYNCGPTRVSNAISKAGGGDDFWAVYQYLPKETRGYVPAFIAVNYVMNYYGDYGIAPLSTGLPHSCDTVIVEKDLTLAKVADVLGMDVADLKILNPQYRQGIVKATSANGAGKLRLPAEMVERFRHYRQLIYQETTPCEGTDMNIAAAELTSQRLNTSQGRDIMVH